MNIVHYIILFVFLLPNLGYSNDLSVAILDTGVDFPYYIGNKHINYDFTNTGYFDHHGHGTNVAGLIYKHAESTEYTIYNLKGIAKSFSYRAYINSLKKAAELKPTILNISAGGFVQLPYEKKLINKILNNGTIIIAAAGNDGINFNKKGCIFYPACYDERIIVVGNKADNSNYGKQVDYILDGNNKIGFNIKLSGSSQSTAIFTGLKIKEMLKKKWDIKVY